MISSNRAMLSNGELRLVKMAKQYTEQRRYRATARQPSQARRLMDRRRWL